MNGQTQWLFETPVTSKTTLSLYRHPHTYPEYSSNSEWETPWKSQGDSLTPLPTGEEEWEVSTGNLSGLSSAEQKALRITSTFETGHSLGFGGLTGNFDRMGISFGLMQWNIGSGSLQPLLREFARRHPQGFDLVFGVDATKLRRILEPFHKARPKTQSQIMADQMRFAIEINDQRCNPGHKSTHKFCKVIEPWSSYFRRLASDPTFQKIQLQKVRKSMNKAVEYAKQFGFRSERGLALMFDIVTQSGGAWLTCTKPVCKKRAALIKQRRDTLQDQTGQSLTERELLTIIANVIADTSLPDYKDDVRIRKMTIVNGYGKVHGTQFDLARDFKLTDQPWKKSSEPTHHEFLFDTKNSVTKNCIKQGNCSACERRVRATNPTQMIPVPAALIIDKRQIFLNKQALDAYQRLDQAARAEGIPEPYLKIISGYRSYDHQVKLWKGRLLTKFRKMGCSEASLPCIGHAIERTSQALRSLPIPHPNNAWLERFLQELQQGVCALSCNPQVVVAALRHGTAPPGASPHHTGRVVDVFVGKAPSAETSASTKPDHVAWQRRQPSFQWLVCNAARFGFYPYNVEPWHWEYNPPI